MPIYEEVGFARGSLFVNIDPADDNPEEYRDEIGCDCDCHEEEGFPMAAITTQNVEETEETDPFGIVGIFKTHLEISLTHMTPEQAFEAAQHATRSYVRSYDFIPQPGRDRNSPPEYAMLPKKS